MVAGDETCGSQSGVGWGCQWRMVGLGSAVGVVVGLCSRLIGGSAGGDASGLSVKF